MTMFACTFTYVTTLNMLTELQLAGIARLSHIGSHRAVARRLGRTSHYWRSSWSKMAEQLTKQISGVRRGRKASDNSVRLSAFYYYVVQCQAALFDRMTATSLL
jgi:hypothetical protein